MTARLIALTDTEVDRLFGAGPLAVALYLVLRTAMDYLTGEVGRSTPISLAGLARACETHTPRGAGTQITQPTEKEIRNALDRLRRIGLLRRLPGDRLVFRLPLALTARARPAHTGHGEGAGSSTEPGAGNAAPALAMQAEPGTDDAPQQTQNRAHVNGYEIQNPTVTLRPAVDNFARATRRPQRSAEEPTRPIPPRPACAEGEDHRLLQVGARLGLTARPGETWRDFGARVAQARAGGQALRQAWAQA